MTDRDRIADLEARLAMACQALLEADTRLYTLNQFHPEDDGWIVDMRNHLHEVREGNTEKIAAFLARVKRQGVAEELRAQSEALLRESEQFDKSTSLAMRGIALRFAVRAAELEREV